MKQLKIAFIFIFCIGISNNVDAQFKDLQNMMGGGDKKESSSADITSIQANLISDLTDALGDVLAAQALIAEAQGNKELAAALENTANKMAGGDVSNDDIKGAVQQTKEAAELQQEEINKKNVMDGEAKKLYAKALLPYIKSVAKTAKLSGPIKDFMNEAQNSIKSIKNPMQIRKLKSSLDTGLFVGKNVPKLIVTLGKSSKDLLTYSKDNGLDTSSADDIELDL
tara:strand:+ start:960 stop:1634 length:675 start_codon:yes stop_codon:yes gene_type:complete